MFLCQKLLNVIPKLLKVTGKNIVIVIVTFKYPIVAVLFH